MAVVMFMEWDGVTIEQYEAARKLVNWEGDNPAGGMFHVAAVTDAGLRVTDLWQSAEAFQTFVEKRLASSRLASRVSRGCKYILSMLCSRQRSELHDTWPANEAQERTAPRPGWSAAAQHHC